MVNGFLLSVYVCDPFECIFYIPGMNHEVCGSLHPCTS
jgi:hypothetical protein